jgi:glycerate kinase
MRFLVAPDSFKESLSAAQASSAIAAGLRSVFADDAGIDECPLADGGEGTVDALVNATGGTSRTTTVTGPLGEPIDARWGMLGGREQPTAIIEMAAASGLALVPDARRDPRKTTTFGTGELIRTAINAGCERVLIGIGGSATNDGGIGCAQALGVRFLDRNGKVLPDPATGATLSHIGRIDITGREPRLGRVAIQVACDVDNPLCGPRGAAAVYSPQKGATPEIVAELDAGLSHLAQVIQTDLKIGVRDIPGAGAAGGLGAGLIALLNASLRPGIDIVCDAVGFDERLRNADCLITGEGRLDRQSVMGKVIGGVARRARAANVPTIALVGSFGEGVEAAHRELDACLSIVDRPMPLEQALAEGQRLLTQAAACVARLLRIGRPR